MNQLCELDEQQPTRTVNSQSNSNHRPPGANSKPLISTNSIARPQQAGAPTNSHKSQPTASGAEFAPDGLVGGRQAGPSSPSGANNAAASQDQTKTTSGNDLANLAGQQQQQQLQQSTASVIQQQHQFCSPQTSSRNLYWNFTRAGHVAMQSCPEGSSGPAVSWLCDSERLRFVPAVSPDFSQCRSNWLTRLSKQLDQMLEAPVPSAPAGRQAQVSLSSRQQDEEMIKSILGELSLLVKTKELFSEDLKRIDIMISQMIAQLKTFSVLAGGSHSQPMAWQRQQQLNPLVSIYRELFAELTSICSSLFDASFQRNAWLELASNDARRHLETRLLGHLRESGLLLAQSLSVDQLADLQPIRQPNVQAGISVIINNQLKSAIVAAANSDDSPDGTTNELNLFGRLSEGAPGAGQSTSAPQEDAELRLQSQLLNELAANGMTKFLILDIKKPDYSLLRMQLEQQVALEQQQQLPSSAVPLDFGQNLAGAEQPPQTRIFGVFAINGDTGELFGVAPAQQRPDLPLNLNKQQQLDSIRLQRLGELMAQWPLSVEFKLQQQAQSVGGQLAPPRQCQSLASSETPASDLATSSQPNLCHLAKYNATNFVCSCDRFGFLALVQAQAVGAFGGGSTQNDQWSALSKGPGGPFDLQMATQQLADSRAFEGAGDQSFVVNNNSRQPAAGLATYSFLVLGVGLLVLTLAGLVVNVAQRLMSHSSRLSKKQRSFLENFRNGPTTGPLTANHNLMGSDPLVSGAAAQSASIIGQAGGAAGNTLAHQICVGSSTSSGHYKTHQQLYASHLNNHQHHHLNDSPPMVDGYLNGGGPTAARWPIRLLDWLVERPAGWLASLASSSPPPPPSAIGKTKIDGGLIQHRISGQSASSTLGTLAYQKGQYSGHQNGYTTSLGLHQPISHQHPTIARAHHLGSSGSGQSAVPLNPGASSNSSYVSSSAYYEEIGPGNLTKVNPNHHHTMAGDPFSVKQQHSLANLTSGQQWQAATSNSHSNSAAISHLAGPMAPANSVSQQRQQQQATTFGLASNQPMSLITKQHLHNDLSPLQTSSASSSAGSQHSANGHLHLQQQQPNGSANESATPRHYLFASPVAVTAYKHQFRGQHQH